jgi:hypothetical protein
LNRRRKGRKTKQNRRKKTDSRGEERPLHPFLKPLKIIRYEPKPFSSCSCDLGTKREKETPSKWPRILAPTIKAKLD